MANLECLGEIDARRRARVFELRDAVLDRQGIRRSDYTKSGGLTFGGGTFAELLVNFDERLRALEKDDA